MSPNTLPKSLHTVTVLVNVARTVYVLTDGDAPTSVDTAVAYALTILGYADTPDAYGLGNKACAVLLREVRS